jgi:ABC-2 type transport system permease protein
MNGPLLRHTVRSQRLRLLAVSIGLFQWGLMLPIVYSQFGATFRDLLETGVIPEVFAEFGGGNVFTLPGSIALGFIHPIALVLVGVFAVGFGTSAIAGERQRGTLEILLSRPISRRGSYVTLLVCTIAFVGICLAAFLLGSVVSSSAFGVIDEIDLAQLPLVWLNGLLLYGSFATIALAASASFDRLAPALGITLAILLVSYFFEILGSLWPDAEFLQPYSLFHYLETQEVFAGEVSTFAFGLLAAVCLAAIGWALVVFPRRDLAAPS